MKRILYPVFIFLISSSLSAQNTVTKTQVVNSFINTWGLIKYRHPIASTGTFNMNNEFINEYEKLAVITTDVQLDEELKKWIKKFDNGKLQFKSNKEIIGGKYNVRDYTDNTWITQSGFSKELTENLQEINQNINFGDYYGKHDFGTDYPVFKNEKALENFNVNNSAHRALTLASYWNTIKYWNVNSIITDTKWADVLTELQPDFETNDKITFEKAKEKLIAALNDSHANYESSYTLKAFKKFPVVSGKIINDSLLVVITRNKSIAEKDGISPGDIIFSAEGKPLSVYYKDKFKNVISASNNEYLSGILGKSGLLASAEKDSVQVGILKKNGSVVSKYIHLYTIDKIPMSDPERLYTDHTENYYEVNNEIGYINLGSLTNDELEKAFTAYKNKKGIILDLRCYPSINNTIVTNFLLKDKKEVVKLLTPYLPGYSRYGAPAALSFIKDPFKAGKKNNNYYKGKIVLLVDSKTGSAAEHLAMAIQQAPNCTTIGTQTFGAVMNRKEVILIDGTKADFTFAGTFYTDDTPVQRNGIKIDYSVKETAKNYDPELFIKQAIKIIQN